MTTETANLAPGAFCWVDLFTNDTARAEAFYGELFGWKAQIVAEDGDGPYRIFFLGQDMASGLMGMPPEMKQMNLPPHWTSHVLVTSAAETAARAEQLGGRVLKAPMEVGGVGMLAVVQDPQGAVLCLWQPYGAQQNPRYNEPGNLGWNELWTSDTDAAAKYYTDLFGWQTKESDFGPVKYTVVENQGRGNGGILPLPEEVAARGVPPHWLVYFAVENCDAAVESITRLGGRAHTPTMDIPTVGRFAVVADDQGAAFAVIQMAPKS